MSSSEEEIGNSSDQRITEYRLGHSSCFFFHPHHGKNLVIKNQGTVAERIRSFAHALCFSCRPLRPDEDFTIRIKGQQLGWTGHLRMGLTLQNPSDQQDLPQFMMPELINKGETWGRAFQAEHTQRRSAEGDQNNAADVDSTISVCYSVSRDESIHMHVKVNGRDLGVQHYGLPKTGVNRFFAVVDVYGETSCVQIINPGVPSLLELCRKSVVHQIRDVSQLPLPERLKAYLRCIY